MGRRPCKIEDREEGAMADAQIQGFNHIHIVCTDVATTERWFVDGLKADLVERRDSRGAPTSELSLAGVRILLRSARDDEGLASDGQRRFGTDHFGLTVSNVDETVETLRGRGIQISVEPRNSPKNRIAFIKGPDNVLIELVEPGAQR